MRACKFTNPVAWVWRKKQRCLF